MAVRATMRGPRRTPLRGRWDAVVCGASFAGLAVAGELAGAMRADRGEPARVLLLDRYEIGERQTSACAAPTDWLEALGVGDAVLQTFGELVVHTRARTRAVPLPWTFSTFDYRAVCAALWESCDARFETATVRGRSARTVHTDRGDVQAPLLVDALGWRRVLSNGPPVQPPDATLSRGLEVHPAGRGSRMELWIDSEVIPAGYGWSFPAREEVRIGIGSFRPRDHVKRPTIALAARAGRPAEGYQGNWIPHEMRAPVEDGVFFCGDAAGHCLPTTAEGIRTAWAFGIVCGREVRAVLEDRQGVEAAQRRYARACEAQRWKSDALLRIQRIVPRMPDAALDVLVWLFTHPSVAHPVFERYLRVAPPAVAAPRPRVRRRPPSLRDEGVEPPRDGSRPAGGAPRSA